MLRRIMSTHRRCWAYGAWIAALLLACGDPAQGTHTADAVDAPRDVSPGDAADGTQDTGVAAPDGDAADSHGADQDGELDADLAAPSDIAPIEDATPDDAHDAVDAHDAADAHDAVDASGDVAADIGDVALPAVLTCPMAPMDQLYSGILPPNPYAAWPAAPSCVTEPHDAIIVLGCPSNADGSASTCQLARAGIALRLRATGYADRFIVSGAAVHNAWVEAEALRDLLLAGGVPAERVHLEPQARHTDENLYYATQIMLGQGWRSALVVSDDPGHLMMTAVCDSNCCVDLGRLTLFALPVTGGLSPTDNVGHYVLIPPAAPIAPAECATIEGPLKFMCTNLGTRKACKANFQL